MTRYNADLDAITGLHAALGSFAAQQFDALAAIENEIAASIAMLEQAEEDWRTKTQQREQEMWNCSASGVGAGNDCSREAEALRQAEEKLNGIKLLSLRLQDGLASYRAAGQSFKSVLENELPQARAYLSDRIAALAEYGAAQVSSTTGAAPRTSSHRSEDRKG